MSVPTIVLFQRELTAHSADEVQLCYQVLAARERDFVNISPQQRAWFQGARAMAAWLLGLPKGGRKIAEMLEGVATPGVVSLTVADDWMQQRRDVLAGLSAGNFNIRE